MTTHHAPESLSQIAEGGRQLEALLAHPGWRVLQEGFRRYHEEQTDYLMTLKADEQSVRHVDVIGQMKGVAAVENRIVPDLRRNAKRAAAELRSREEGA